MFCFLPFRSKSSVVAITPAAATQQSAFNTDACPKNAKNDTSKMHLDIFMTEYTGKEPFRGPPDLMTQFRFPHPGAMPHECTPSHPVKPSRAKALCNLVTSAKELDLGLRKASAEEVALYSPPPLSSSEAICKFYGVCDYTGPPLNSLLYINDYLKHGNERTDELAVDRLVDLCRARDSDSDDEELDPSGLYDGLYGSEGLKQGETMWRTLDPCTEQRLYGSTRTAPAMLDGRVSSMHKRAAVSGHTISLSFSVPAGKRLCVEDFRQMYAAPMDTANTFHYEHAQTPSERLNKLIGI
ncbi:hypothetical protein SAICODRAFT_28915 [Saitoella complicata NRRL Y-17804]|uniref:uncharacterized protein n=1 Tax=Saitoella complicata (strain BCRC 22490 / CBS 7301 / JCM 7358 / NBRC 10748 / NRRL Y-17804) TaxID=698492 RepID=UPI000867C602|nr:uncharacterized protein SAICODRAFT_28915 [Saitoella complicata NRRL Y-17804]ODQ55242.1 hypothetical protein SAICODRAFT_28915 [Saitoella complicata NRRL Y-17804]